MLRVVLRLIPVVAGVLAVTVVVVRVGYMAANPLQDADVFRDGPCHNPCWRGLEVGVAPRADIEGALGVDANEDIYFITTDVYDGYLLLGDHQTLTLIRLEYATCPESIFAAYGVPNSIITDQRGPVYLFYGDRGTMIVYSGGQFTVQLSTRSPSRAGTSRNVRHDIAWNVMLREMRPYCS